MPSSGQALPSRPEPAALVWRTLFALTLTLTVAAVLGNELVGVMLPHLRSACHWIDGDFTVLSLKLTQNRQETVVAMQVNLAHAIQVGRQIVHPHPQGMIEVSTPAGTMLQPVVAALTVALAWPASVRRTLIAATIATALGLAALCIDLPFTLMAFAREMFYEHYDPQGTYLSLLQLDFLKSGGRIALGLVMGAGAVAFSHGVLPARDAATTARAA